MTHTHKKHHLSFGEKYLEIISRAQQSCKMSILYGACGAFLSALQERREVKHKAESSDENVKTLPLLCLSLWLWAEGRRPGTGRCVYLGAPRVSVSTAACLSAGPLGFCFLKAALSLVSVSNVLMGCLIWNLVSDLKPRGAASAKEEWIPAPVACFIAWDGAPSSLRVWPEAVAMLGCSVRKWFPISLWSSCKAVCADGLNFKASTGVLILSAFKHTHMHIHK